MVPKIAYMLLPKYYKAFSPSISRLSFHNFRWLLESHVERVIVPTWWLLRSMYAFGLNCWTNLLSMLLFRNLIFFHLWVLLSSNIFAIIIFSCSFIKTLIPVVIRIIIELVIKDQITCVDYVGRYILHQRFECLT